MKYRGHSTLLSAFIELQIDSQVKKIARTYHERAYNIHSSVHENHVLVFN